MLFRNHFQKLSLLTASALLIGTSAGVALADDGAANKSKTVEIFGIKMQRTYGPYVRYGEWLGKIEEGSAMQFWKQEDELSGWYALVNSPEDLSSMGSQFKFVRTAATRFQVDCLHQRIRPVERVHTAGPFLKGEVMLRRPINRPWVEIEKGEVSVATIASNPDLRYDAGIIEIMYAVTCQKPE